MLFLWGGLRRRHGWTWRLKSVISWAFLDNIPPEASCFCFSCFSRSPKEKPTEIRIHFLGVGLSNPLRGYSRQAQPRLGGKEGVVGGVKQCQSHDPPPPLLPHSSSPVCLFHLFRWHYFTIPFFQDFHRCYHTWHRGGSTWHDFVSFVAQEFTFYFFSKKALR